MTGKTQPRHERPTDVPRDRDHRQDPHEPLPTWRNTQPRGNPEPDRRDLERSRERFESLLGR